MLNKIFQTFKPCYLHLFCLISSLFWLLCSSVLGFYFMGWLALAILCGFFLSVYFVQPLFELIQVGLLHLEQKRDWRIIPDKGSLFFYRIEIVERPTYEVLNSIRLISFLVVMAPFLFITITVKGPVFVFALITQIFWLCACALDFRES